MKYSNTSRPSRKLDLIGTSHPCLTFDKWKTLLLVDDDYNVLDELDTLF